MSTRPDEAVLTGGERLAVFLLWLAFAWIPSLTLWALTGYYGKFYYPLLWLVTLGASARAMGRMLGQVEQFDALPGEERPLPHLPAALARMVGEAASIREELAADEYEAALERAWILHGEYEQLPPDIGVDLDPGRAALAAVRELAELRARPGRAKMSRGQQKRRLDAALAQFAATLAEPTRVGFR
jgi:hypothetical protein